MENLSVRPSLPSRFRLVVYFFFLPFFFFAATWITSDLVWDLLHLVHADQQFFVGPSVCKRKIRSHANLFFACERKFFDVKEFLRAEFVEHTRVRLHEADQKLRVEHAERTLVGAGFGETIELV